MSVNKYNFMMDISFWHHHFILNTVTKKQSGISITTTVTSSKGTNIIVNRFSTRTKSFSGTFCAYDGRKYTMFKYLIKIF